MGRARTTVRACSLIGASLKGATMLEEQACPSLLCSTVQSTYIQCTYTNMHNTEKILFITILYYIWSDLKNVSLPF